MIRKTDIWPISSAQISKNNAFKICLVYTIMSLFVSIFLETVSLTSSNVNGADFRSLFIMTAVCFLLLILLPFGLNYLRFKRLLYMDKAFSSQTRYDFSDKNIHVSSICQNNVIQWDAIDRIVETKPCFFIHYSKYKLVILPRRCFSEQTQLEQFRILLQSNIAAGKLHQVQFKIGHTYAKTLIDISEQIQEKAIESELNSFILNLKFHFNREEIIFFSLRRYYMQTFGIIMTLIGIYILFDFSKLLATGIGDSYVFYINIIFLAFQLIFGLMFLFLIPFLICFSANKRKKLNGSFYEERIYQFGEEMFNIGIGADKTAFRWNELTKITENRNGFILIIRPRKSYYLPKRVFENAEDAERFDELIKKHG